MRTLTQKVISLILCSATLLTGCTTLLSPSDTGENGDTAFPEVSGILNSAAALDCGENTYFLDESGKLLLGDSESGASLPVADIAANEFVLGPDDTLIYSDRQGSIRSQKIDGSDPSVLYDGNLASGSFALQSGNLWFTGKDAFYLCKEGEDARCVLEVTGISDISMRSENEILIRAVNIAYIPEQSGDEIDFGEGNDQYVSYLYTVSTGLLVPYREQLEIEDESDPEITPVAASGVISIGNTTYPFADYPVDSFFTKNGKSCTCHNQGICVESGPKCNCMRYYPTGVRATCTVDLLSSQCMGFARFCMWRTYGYFDGGAGADKCYNALGSKLAAGKWTPNTIKSIFTKVGPGGHLRTGTGHSLFVISVSSTGFITYECNRSTVGKNCMIFTRTWTWDTFVSKYGSRDLLYYNLPKDKTYTPSDDEMKPGTYQTLANSLNMRKSATTGSAILTTIPYETILTVTETRAVGSYYWGKTSYNGYTGWVRLDYAVYLSGKMTGIKITELPNKTIFFESDKFDNSGMEVTAFFSDGTSIVIQGYSCTGYNMNKAGRYTVTVSANGFSDSYELTVRSHAIYPTSITLDRSSLVLIEGDSFTLTPTLLPEDTTQRDIRWTSSKSSVATVKNGVLTILKAGETTITATTENNLTAKLQLTVVAMPTGTEWSVTASGDPLPALPEGIDPQDYSIRYQTRKSDGSWSEWIYAPVPADPDGEIRCQFRSFTVTFISDGKDIYTPKAVDVNTYIELKDYQLQKSGYLFAGWFSTNKAALRLDKKYACASKIRITGDLTLYAGWIELSPVVSEEGDPYSSGNDCFGLQSTALKVDADGVGIRYFTKISSSLIADLEKIHSGNSPLAPSSSKRTGVGYGTILIQESSLSQTLTKPSSSANYVRDGRAVIVPAVNRFENYNGYLIYDAYLTGFERGDYEKGYVARPYLTYKDCNGFEHTYLPDYDGDNAIGGGMSADLKTLTDAEYAKGDFIICKMIDDYIYDVFVR